MAMALIDNWVQEEGNATFDAGGSLAGQGRIDEAILTSMLDHPWFDQPPPKPLDREDFTLETVRGLSLADGAAPLTALTVNAAELALRNLTQSPSTHLDAGGGRQEHTLVRQPVAVHGDAV